MQHNASISSSNTQPRPPSHTYHLPPAHLPHTIHHTPYHTDPRSQLPPYLFSYFIPSIPVYLLSSGSYWDNLNSICIVTPFPSHIVLTQRHSMDCSYPPPSNQPLPLPPLLHPYPFSILTNLLKWKKRLYFQLNLWKNWICKKYGLEMFNTDKKAMEYTNLPNCRLRVGSKFSEKKLFLNHWSCAILIIVNNYVYYAYSKDWSR